MVMQIRAGRGGFLRPFGCGWFIREFLLGHGPEESPKINPEVGSWQEEIFYHYKIALHKAYARDVVAWENDQLMRAGKEGYTEEEYAARVDWYFQRIPYKLVKCRSHSFHRYFHWLKQLGWVETTGQQEKSAVQEVMPNFPDAPPKIYYRLTREGVDAPDYEWSNPQMTLYPERGLEYFREKRAERTYVPRRPTKRRES